MQSIVKSLILWFFFWASSGALNAQVLEDLSDGWENRPTGSWFKSNDQISQLVDLSTFPQSNLYLEVPSGTVVFAGEKLWFFAESDTLLLRQVASIAEELDVKELKLTLFKEGIQPKQANIAKILGQQLVESKAPVVAQEAKQRSQNRQEIRDFFTLAMIAILLLMAVYKLAYPYIFGLMLQPRGLLSDEDFSDMGSMQKFFSLDVVFYVFIVNLFLSLLTLMSLSFFRPDLIEMIREKVAVSLIVIWLLGGIGFLTLTIVKFLGIRLIAFLFDLARVEYAHFFYLLRLIVWSGMLVLMVMSYYLFNSFYSMDRVITTLLTGFFWFYLVGVFILFVMMMNRLSFKKYHLFTYLCIAELVPFLVFAKWILGLGQF
ncbi:MAG: DUF4271 domain-containing protein [Bacteroidota bacterium]